MLLWGVRRVEAADVNGNRMSQEVETKLLNQEARRQECGKQKRRFGREKGLT